MDVSGWNRGILRDDWAILVEIVIGELGRLVERCDHFCRHSRALLDELRRQNRRAGIERVCNRHRDRVCHRAFCLLRGDRDRAHGLERERRIDRFADDGGNLESDRKLLKGDILVRIETGAAHHVPRDCPPLDARQMAERFAFQVGEGLDRGIIGDDQPVVDAVHLDAAALQPEYLKRAGELGFRNHRDPGSGTGGPEVGAARHHRFDDLVRRLEFYRLDL